MSNWDGPTFVQSNIDVSLVLKTSFLRIPFKKKLLVTIIWIFCFVLFFVIILRWVGIILVGFSATILISSNNSTKSLIFTNDSWPQTCRSQIADSVLRPQTPVLSGICEISCTTWQWGVPPPSVQSTLRPQGPLPAITYCTRNGLNSLWEYKKILRFRAKRLIQSYNISLI